MGIAIEVLRNIGGLIILIAFALIVRGLFLLPFVLIKFKFGERIGWVVFIIAGVILFAGTLTYMFALSE